MVWSYEEGRGTNRCGVIMLLFKTIHGSHLYGLAHEGSDTDYFQVVTKVKTNKKKYAKQSIYDGVDTTTLDLGTFLHYCEMGVPQALEAMMSQRAVYDRIGPLRAQYRAGTQTWSRYLRTIKSFALQDDVKHKRHALRLALNLNKLMNTGRFNPTLTQEQAEFITLAARTGSSAFVYDMALDIVWHNSLDSMLHP